MEDFEKKTANAYDNGVDDYYNATKDLEGDRLKIREEFMSMVSPAGKILDLGCGPGRDAKIFSEKGHNVIGIDLSPRMILKAKTIAPKAEFKVMSFLNLEFEPESLGAVWFEDGLVCIRKGYAPKLIKNLNKIMKRGAIFYLSVTEGNGEGMIMDSTVNRERYYANYTQEEISKLLMQNDFEIKKIFRPELKTKDKWICLIAKKKLISQNLE